MHQIYGYVDANYRGQVTDYTDAEHMRKSSCVVLRVRDCNNPLSNTNECDGTFDASGCLVYTLHDVSIETGCHYCKFLALIRLSTKIYSALQATFHFH